MLIHRALIVVLLAGLAFVGRSHDAQAEANTITTLSTYASDSALTLDAAGNPVVAYRDSLDAKLRVLHCDDPYCMGGGESLTTPDIQAGQHPSITLDASGHPAISYYTVPFDRVKLLRCDDPDCAGVESIETPDPEQFLLNASTSIALDASGNPVIAYALWSPHYEIRVMHCNDPACTGGDESITAHDSLAAAPSLALDSSGNPVVAYYRAPSQVFTAGTLRVMHCNDPDCSGGDETVTTPDATGIMPSLQLDAAGNPVIAYDTGASTNDLRVMHCNDPNCAGSNESVATPDSTGDVGGEPSLALAGGNPVVSYRDEDNEDLKLLRCNDPDCLIGGDVVVSLDTAADSGEHSSLVIDSGGRPAISYDAGADLRLIRCGDADCAETVGGVAELAGPLDSADATSWMPQVLVGVILLVLAVSGGLLALRPARRR